MEFVAPLVENRSLDKAGGAWRGSFVLRLGQCGPLASSAPGQFVMLRGEWGRDPLLPRAFSILRMDGEVCEILVKVVGRGTRLLADLAVGAKLHVLGPLGHRFPAPEAGRSDLLVAGGVGLAPLLWHAEEAARAGVTVDLFYGARSGEDLVLLDEIRRLGDRCRLHLATEDGSVGTRGRVTSALEERLAGGRLGPRPTLLTCGPNAMMRAVAEIARARALDCLVSVEGEMACGIGACLGCAIPTAPGQDDKPFRYACTDGPVFDTRKIVLP